MPHRPSQVQVLAFDPLGDATQQAFYHEATVRLVVDDTALSPSKQGDKLGVLSEPRGPVLVIDDGLIRPP